MVDAAKAFCPECGNSMEVEEQRQTTTEFNLFDATQKLTHSGRIKVLQEMQLDISESPPLQETHQEPQPQSVAENPSKSNAAFWIIIGIVAFGFMMILILAIAGVFFYMR
jgi:hypothetical protein